MPMVRRLALGAIAAATSMVGAAYASAFLPGGAPRWAEWAFVLGTAAMMSAMMLLGATAGDRRAPPVAWLAIAFTFAVLVVGLGAAILLPPPAPGDRLWLGLPAGAAAVLYGVGLLPLLVLPLAYARSFDSAALGEEALARLRAAADAVAADARPVASPGVDGDVESPGAVEAVRAATPRGR